MQVGAVLHHIETGNLLPPLVVLTILAKNPTLQLGVVKDYMARQLSAESTHIQEDRAQIAKYQQETAQMRAEVRELRTQVRLPLCIFRMQTAVKQMHSESAHEIAEPKRVLHALTCLLDRNVCFT